MSRRCRASLQDLSSGNTGGSGTSGAGCGCGRTPTVPCLEPIVYGSNILLDPSFEQFAGRFGLNTGPDEETFPGEYGPSSGGPSVLTWAGFPPLLLYDGPLPHWAVFSNDEPGTDPENRAVISTADPNTGTYHVRFVTDDLALHPAFDNSMSPLGFYACDRITTHNSADLWKTNNGRTPWTAIVAPGDLLVMSIRAKASVLTDDPIIELGVTTAAQAFDPITNQWPSFAFPEIALTTSYVTYSFSAFMPANAYYLNALYSVSIDSGPTVRTVFDTDDATLSLIAAGPSILLCAFASLITIDNSTTETSFV